ncbi:MAG: hypothetical protein MSA42_06225, partial [Mollicutes bacterium]|nr:hypothetical protein [Mollicutes bacterium]
FFLSFVVVYLNTDAKEPYYDINFPYFLLYSVIFFGIPLLISGEFVTIPINKTAKKFQQNYHDSQEEKRK